MARPSSPPEGLSANEADEVASRYRASWEPPPPGEDFDAEGDTAIDAEKSGPGRAEPTEIIPTAEADLPTRGARRPVILAGAAGLLALVGLAVSLAVSTDFDAPPDRNSVTAVSTGSVGAEVGPLDPAPPTPPQAQFPQAASETTEPSPVSDAVDGAQAGEVAPAEATAGSEETAPPTAIPDPAPAPSMARLEASTVPRHARLTLDGQTVQNPLDRSLEQGQSYVLEASAPGFRQLNRTVRLDQDASVILELRPARRPANRRKQTRPRSRTKTRMNRTTMARTGGAGFVSDNPY